MRYGLGIEVTHIVGKQYANVYRYDGRGGSIWFASVECGASYSNAVTFVSALNGSN